MNKHDEPEVTTELAQGLGMTRSELNIPAWELLSEYFQADGKELIDFYSQRKSLFNYVDAIC